MYPVHPTALSGAPDAKARIGFNQSNLPLQHHLQTQLRTWLVRSQNPTSIPQSLANEHEVYNRSRRRSTWHPQSATPPVNRSRSRECAQQTQGAGSAKQVCIREPRFCRQLEPAGQSSDAQLPPVSEQQATSYVEDFRLCADGPLFGCQRSQEGRVPQPPKRKRQDRCRWGCPLRGPPVSPSLEDGVGASGTAVRPGLLSASCRGYIAG